MDSMAYKKFILTMIVILALGSFSVIAYKAFKGKQEKLEEGKITQDTQAIKQAKREKIMQIEDPVELKEEVMRSLSVPENTDKTVKKSAIANLFVRYIYCQKEEEFAPLVQEMIAKDNALFMLLLQDRHNRWSTEKICPDTLPTVCRNNEVRKIYIPDSFCDNICEKLSQYDNDRDKLMDEIIINDFKNWEDGSSLSKWLVLRVVIAWRYGKEELATKICNSGLTKEERNKCLDIATETERFKNDYNTGLDFAKETIIKDAQKSEVEQLVKEMIIKGDMLFSQLLLNYDNRYPIAEICPVILETECENNEVRKTYVPDSFCDNICEKLSQYDDDYDKLMDEIIINDFKNWEDGDSISAGWQFLRKALAWRYGQNELVIKICDHVPTTDYNRCINFAKIFTGKVSVWKPDITPCNIVQGKISDVIVSD